MAEKIIISLSRTLALAVFLCLSLVTSAQEDVEYRYDIGVGAGLTTYYGDFNSRFMGNLQPAGSAILRKVINPWSAFRIAGMLTKASGEYNSENTYYSDLQEKGYTFSTTIADLSATYEYNFWPYGTGKEYRGAQRIAPFIALGVGITAVKCKDAIYDYTNTKPRTNSKHAISANVPIGFGVKYRIKDRINVTIDYTMHFSLTDNIDGVKDPYRIKSDGLFKNTDCYSTLMIALSYSFSAKCPTCMKDR